MSRKGTAQRCSIRATAAAVPSGIASPRYQTDDRAELLGLLLIEIALLEDLELPVRILFHEQQVDQADDVVLLQARELLADLAREVVSLEADDEHLYRA